MHLRDKAAEAKGRDLVLRTIYNKTLIFLWVPTLLWLAGWTYQGRAFEIIGQSFDGTLANWIGLVVAIGICLLFYTQIVRVKRSDAMAKSTLGQIEGEQGIQDIMPTTQPEYRQFQLLSVSAGITEEIMFRGFLVWGLAHYMPVWVAAALSLTSFTLAHLYQESIKSVMRVFLAGLAFTLIYLLSDSLLNAVIVHAAVDLGSGGLIWYARQKVEGGK